MKDYNCQLDELKNLDPFLGHEIATLANLEAILKWIPIFCGSMKDVDLVQQDEYCYDFLVPLPDSRWIAFAVT